MGRAALNLLGISSPVPGAPFLRRLGSQCCRQAEPAGTVPRAQLRKPWWPRVAVQEALILAARQDTGSAWQVDLPLGPGWAGRRHCSDHVGMRGGGKGQPALPVPWNLQ